MVNTSTKIESLKHSLLGGTLCGGLASIQQLYYNNQLVEILNSGGAQFVVTSINGFINLRIYNSVKRKVFEITNNKRQSELSGAAVSGLETFLTTYMAQELIRADGSTTL